MADDGGVEEVRKTGFVKGDAHRLVGVLVKTEKAVLLMSVHSRSLLFTLVHPNMPQ